MQNPYLSTNIYQFKHVLSFLLWKNDYVNTTLFIKVKTTLSLETDTNKRQIRMRHLSTGSCLNGHYETKIVKTRFSNNDVVGDNKFYKRMIIVTYAKKLHKVDARFSQIITLFFGYDYI